MAAPSRRSPSAQTCSTTSPQFCPPRRYRAIAPGKSSPGTTAKGASRAVPRLRARSRPARRRPQAPRPLDGRSPWRGRKCDRRHAPSRNGTAAAATAGAKARAAMCADEQIGAPAQATMRRRGSSAHAMKPSSSAASANARLPRQTDRDQHSAVRGARVTLRLLLLRTCTSASSADAWAWPKANPIRSQMIHRAASESEIKQCDRDSEMKLTANPPRPR